MLLGFKAQNHPQQTFLAGVKNEVDDRALPEADFAKLNERFNFTIDVAAAAHNRKLDRFYSMENSGLNASWSGERVYCNPPFSDITPWVEKAWAETSAPLIVMLLPANRTEQNWWQKYVEPRRDRCGSPLTLEFLPGRMRFLNPGETDVKPNSRPPFGCCLLIFTRS